jgi:hypothetical protein
MVNIVDDLTETHRLLADADRLAAEGRALLDQSISARRAALAAVPAGAVVAHHSSPTWRATRQRNGDWVDNDGHPIGPSWIEDYWGRGSLWVVDDPPAVP